MLPLEHFLQLVHPDAVLVAVHGQKLGLIQPDGLHVAQEGGVLHHHLVAGVDQRLAQQVHGLGGAGDRQDLVRRAVKGKPVLEIGHQAFPKRRVALGGPVLQQDLSLVQQQFLGQLRAGFIRQGAGGGVAARKGDHARHGQQLENLADGAARNAIETAGKLQGFNIHRFLPFLNVGFEGVQSAEFRVQMIMHSDKLSVKAQA